MTTLSLNTTMVHIHINVLHTSIGKFTYLNALSVSVNQLSYWKEN